MTGGRHDELLEAIQTSLAPEAAQEGREGLPLLTRAVVIAEFADGDSRALVRIGLDAGGDDLPRWDASALLLDQLVEVLKRART